MTTKEVAPRYDYSGQITYGTFPPIPEDLSISSDVKDRFSLPSFLNGGYEMVGSTSNTNSPFKEKSIFDKFFH